MKNAEAERKHQKYLAQKAKESEDAEIRYQKNMEKMAKKDLIHAEPGRKKMIRANVPEHKKHVVKTKKVKTDADFSKYFGDDIDFSKIPEDEPEPPKVEEAN